MGDMLALGRKQPTARPRLQTRSYRVRGLGGALRHWEGCQQPNPSYRWLAVAKVRQPFVFTIGGSVGPVHFV